MHKMIRDQTMKSMDKRHMNAGKKMGVKGCVVYGHKRCPSREGGVEIVVEELSTRMVERGINVTCINRRGHHVSGAQYDGEQLTEYKGIKIETVPTIEKKGLAAASAAFFASIKAAFGKYDIVHVHAEGPAVFCWIPKLFHKKVICTCHGLDWDRARWRGTFGGRFIKYGEKMMAKHADEIIVLSKGAQKYFLDTYGRKTVFIPNGVTRPEIKEAKLIEEKWDISKDTYILTLSRLTHEKQILLLIEAYREIDTDKKLIIAGGSSDSDGYVEMLHQTAEEDDRIIFTGFVQGEELEELYSNAYVYVLPSELEGMPLSLLEAMSYGNCCLTSDIPECTDVVEDHGVTFKTNDKEDLKAKLQILVDDPKHVYEYKKAAADYICGRYNWDDVVDKTLSLYRK